MNYTTIEQSKQLVEAGLDPNTADMYYVFFPSHLIEGKMVSQVRIGKIQQIVMGDKPKEMKLTQCWSLGALIDIIKDTCKNICLIACDDESYACSFDKKEGLTTITESFDGETKIIAVLNCIGWLLENNYIKKEIK